MTVSQKKRERIEEEWREGAPFRYIAKDLHISLSTVTRYVRKFKEMDEMWEREERRMAREEANRRRQERMERQRKLIEERKKQEMNEWISNLMRMKRQEKERIVDSLMKRYEYVSTMTHKFARDYPAYFFSAGVDGHYTSSTEAFAHYVDILMGNMEYHSDFREYCIKKMDVDKYKKYPDYWRGLYLKTFELEDDIYNLAVKYSEMKDLELDDFVKKHLIFQIFRPELFRYYEHSLDIIDV